MGLLAIKHRGVDPDEFREKAHALKGLAMEICEDTEAMFEEFGERSGGSSRYRSDYGQRGGYPSDSYMPRGWYGERGNDPYEMQERYRRYGR